MRIRVFLIVISAAVDVGESVSAQLGIRVAHLSIQIGFRHQCEIIEVILLQRFAERVEHLHRQFELQHLIGQRIVSAGAMQILNVFTDQTNNIVDYLVACALINDVVRQQGCQIQQRFQIIVDAILTDEVYSVALCVRIRHCVPGRDLNL